MTDDAPNEHGGDGVTHRDRLQSVLVRLYDEAQVKGARWAPSPLAAVYEGVAALTTTSGSDGLRERPAKNLLHELGVRSVADLRDLVEAIAAEAQTRVVSEMLDDEADLTGDVS